MPTRSITDIGRSSPITRIASPSTGTITGASTGHGPRMWTFGTRSCSV